MKPAPQAFKLLVVDDDEDTRFVIGEFLQFKGWQVALAASGEKALEMLGAEDFHGVLLDLMMPGMPGQAVLREIRARGFTMPIIIISGYGDLASDVLREGAQAYLPKPLDKSQLQQLLALHVGSPKDC